MNHYPRMTELARTFPTLQNADGLDPFEPSRLAKWLRGPAPCHAAIHAGRFLLHLFNSRARYNVGSFQVADAFATWDHKHRDAFIAWCVAPWWP